MESVFVTKATNDFILYYSQGSAAPYIKDVHDESLRLLYLHLPKINMRIKLPLDAVTADSMR